MPLQLTTPKSTGDLDPNASSYGWVKNFELVCIHGNDDQAGNWTSGILPTETFTIQDENGIPHYTNMFGVNGVTGTPVLATTSEMFYQWLIDNGKYAGTYVNTPL